MSNPLFNKEYSFELLDDQDTKKRKETNIYS